MQRLPSALGWYRSFEIEVESDVGVGPCSSMVLHLTEWHEFRELDPAVVLDVVAAPRLLDGRNVLDLGRWRPLVDRRGDMGGRT